MVALGPARADATYSIIATDPAHARVGAAGASCVPYEVIQIYGVAPGKGAFVAQANFDDAAKQAAFDLLQSGATAESVLEAVTSRDFPQAPKMQYGIVDGSGGLATYTGVEALPFALDQQRQLDAVRVGALGNVLTSELVLEQALDGFESGGCDLPERLMLALEAASNGGEGDNRCTPEGRPANSAFLDVTSSEGGAGNVVRISIPDVSPESPIPALRSAFDEWRSAHPCEPVGGNGAGGGGEGGHGAGGNDAADPETGGCACSESAASRPPSSLLVWLGYLAIARRRSPPRLRARC